MKPSLAMLLALALAPDMLKASAFNVGIDNDDTPDDGTGDDVVGDGTNETTVRVGAEDEDGNFEVFTMDKNEFLEALSQTIEDDGPMPHWASRHVDIQNIGPMTQLVTRDGNKTGNGVLFDVTFCGLCEKTKFSIITDACNIIHLTYSDMQNLFHIPKWVMKDFPHSAMEDAVNEYFDDKIEN